MIGVGGGRDVLTASLSGFRDVTGVEYNPIFIHLFSDKYRQFSGADKIPGLKLVVDDARSWFARSQEKFDLVQMSLVDTWAALARRLHAFREWALHGRWMEALFCPTYPKWCVYGVALVYTQEPG